MSRILVVEDELELANLIRRDLQHVGHQVTLAHDGPSAVRAAVADDPELIVLDVMLPGFDGLEVTRRIRQTR